MAQTITTPEADKVTGYGTMSKQWDNPTVDDILAVLDDMQTRATDAHDKSVISRTKERIIDAWEEQ